MYSESPGNIRNQVGRSLNEIREAVTAEDVLSIANHVRLLVALSSPHLKDLSDDIKAKLRFPSSGVDTEALVFERAMSVLETLLPILAERGLYAFLPGDIGDGSGIALTGESEGPTQEVPLA